MERDKTVAELAGALLEIENHATSADNPKLEDWPKLFAELSARLAPSGNTRKDLRIPVQGEFTLKVDDREVVVQAQDVSHGGIGLRCAPPGYSPEMETHNCAMSVLRGASSCRSFPAKSAGRTRRTPTGSGASGSCLTRN